MCMCHGLRALSLCSTTKKFLDVSYGKRPRDGIVADKDFKNPNKEANTSRTS